MNFILSKEILKYSKVYTTFFSSTNVYVYSVSIHSVILRMNILVLMMDPRFYTVRRYILCSRSEVSEGVKRLQYAAM